VTLTSRTAADRVVDEISSDITIIDPDLLSSYAHDESRFTVHAFVSVTRCGGDREIEFCCNACLFECLSRSVCDRGQPCRPAEAIEGICY